MDELLESASRALCANDAETLERLAAEARMHSPAMPGNLAELVRAQAVFSAQVEAAAAHLAMRSRIAAAAEGYKAATSYSASSGTGYRTDAWRR